MGQKMWGYRCAFVAFASLALPAPLRAEDDASNESAPSSGQNRAALQAAAERRIEAALDSPLRAPMDFVSQPLSDVVHVISDDYQIPIVIDTAALDAVASSPDVEVSFSIANVTFRSALELMLKSVGEGDLTYIIDNEVLMITTLEEAEKRLDVRVYRVDDLVASSHEELLSWSDEADFDSLIDLIVATVEHESWMENGTGEGDIQPFRPGMIVVSQTRRVHELIEQLLQQLRTSKKLIDAELADARETTTDQPMTRSIGVRDESIASCQTTRKTIRDAILKSVDWDCTVEGVDNGTFFLNVLPNRVLVRHMPEVVRQVEQVVRDIFPTHERPGALGCSSGMSGGMGGTSPAASSTPSSSSQSASPGSSNSADLADSPSASEDGKQKPTRGGGRGGF